MKLTPYKRLVLIAGVFFLGLGLWSGTIAQGVAGSDSLKPLPDTIVPFARDHIVIKKANGESLGFNVEIAESERQQEYGLMNRLTLPRDSGMLFLFRGEGKRVFWMKDTLIPLDMLFVSHDGAIHHIHHNAKPQDLTGITSEADSLAVLELKGGTCDRLGIKEGDKILYTVFKNVGIH